MPVASAPNGAEAAGSGGRCRNVMHHPVAQHEGESDAIVSSAGQRVKAAGVAEPLMTSIAMNKDEETALPQLLS